MRNYLKLKKPRFSRTKTCLTVFVLLVVCAIVWSTLRSYRNPVVTEVTIESDKVTNPVRYVFIADLHENVFRENKRPPLLKNRSFS